MSELTFERESENFLHSAGGGQSEHTYKTYRSGLSYFQQYLEEKHDWTDERPLTELHPEMFQQLPTWLLRQTYRRTENSAPTTLAESTRSLYLLAVTRFLRFLVLRKQLPHFDYTEYNRIKEELAQATNVKQKPVTQKIPGPEIIKALIEAAQEPPDIPANAPPATRRRRTLMWRRNLAIVHALRSSGMRVGELVALRRGDLDYSRQGAWVEGKGRKTRFIAFDDVAWHAIESYLEDRADEALMSQLNIHPIFCRHDRKVKLDMRLPLGTRSVQNVIKALSEQADVARKFNLSPHSLRHYFANGLLAFTDNLALVQDALGHQSPATTRIYTEVQAEQIAAQVRAMSRSDDLDDDPVEDED